MDYITILASNCAPLLTFPAGMAAFMFGSLVGVGAFRFARDVSFKAVL